MLTFGIIALIAGYSGWHIYKSVRNKTQGKCDYCTGCSMNGACPLQALKQNGLQPPATVSLIYNEKN